MTNLENIEPLSDAELKHARGLLPEARLEYFLEQALALESLWALEKDGQLLLLGLADGKQALPVFPRQELAALEAADAGEQPKGLDLGEFLDGILPELAAQGRVLGIFPVEGDAFLMQPQALLNRILEEWEGDD